MGFTAKDKHVVIKALEQILSAPSRYMGPPTFSYVIGDYTVSRDGYIDGPSDEVLEKARMYIMPELEHADITADADTAVSMRNLIFMIRSKQYLLERSLGYRAFDIPDGLIDAIKCKDISSDDILTAVIKHDPAGIVVSDGKLRITGFPKGKAFDELTKAIVEYSRNKRNVLPDETITENERYYMRAWLVRIGIKDKETRKLLLKNLKGHTAFRTEKDAQNWKAKHYADKRDNEG